MILPGLSAGCLGWIGDASGPFWLRLQSGLLGFERTISIQSFSFEIQRKDTRDVQKKQAVKKTDENKLFAEVALHPIKKALA